MTEGEKVDEIVKMRGRSLICQENQAKVLKKHPRHIST
jgi:translation initiation factor IF-3